MSSPEPLAHSELLRSLDVCRQLCVIVCHESSPIASKDISIGLYREKHDKILLSETIRHRALIFGKYEGRSICNENSVAYPKVLYLQPS